MNRFFFLGCVALTLFMMSGLFSLAGCRSTVVLEERKKGTVDAGEKAKLPKEPHFTESKRDEPILLDVGADAGEIRDKNQAPEKKPDLDPNKLQPLRDGMLVRVRIIIDGDTVYVYAGNKSWPYYKIRMLGYNSPECKKGKNSHDYGCIKDDERYGLAAYEYLLTLLDREDLQLTVSCPIGGKKGQLCKKDPYDRYLAYLLLPNGDNPAIKMLEAGYAVVYTIFYPPFLKELCRAEAKAIREKKGMWVTGREDAKSGMNDNTLGWYFYKTGSRAHDAICSRALGESFATLAGEK